MFVLGFKMAGALLLGVERQADTGAACCLFIGLSQPSPHGRLAVLQVAANVPHAQALFANNLHDVQLELGVECPSLFLVMFPAQVNFTYRGVRGN
ncbi:hypothetical protein LN047_20455 [Achromobacter sp. JD417]|uniref:hypothetical protein n=1 Tax=Achromobacter sp. JD417 TaxID=2893881 RepID=UPI0005285E92|nr:MULTISPECIES: hypothetical protein [Alcaligenaceae]MCD0498046.1 hypothetical protein [Achromobacter sp. MY14]